MTREVPRYEQVPARMGVVRLYLQVFQGPVRVRRLRPRIDTAYKTATNSYNQEALINTVRTAWHVVG